MSKHHEQLENFGLTGYQEVFSLMQAWRPRARGQRKGSIRHNE
jgi:hypothetical protein